MAVNLVVSVGLSYIKDMDFGEKVDGVVLVILSRVVVVGIGVIMAKTGKEEWEIEQEENAAKKE